MIRTALLSFWHVHAMMYAKQAIDHPEIDLVAIWDEDPKRGQEGATELNLPFIGNLDELLARSDIDGVIVTAPTSLHLDIISRAAKAGKHIFSDKVLAPTIKEANEIVATVDAAKVVLVVGMYALYHDYTLRIKEIIDSGKLGTLVNIRMMNCHGMAIEGTLPPGFYSFQEASGGALIDMCHIVYLLPYFFGGLPTSAFARFGYITKHEVEDSAVVLFDYANGAHATLEAGFVTKGAPKFEIEVHGTMGSVLFRMDSQTGLKGDSILLARIGDEKRFTDVEFGIPGTSPIALWAQHIANGTRPDENIARALDLSRLNEAVYLSANQDRAVALSSLTE